jgi:molybdenum cofactor cytidylyltransferase
MDRHRRSAAEGLWTVVLAAGGSRRLGAPKQLVRARGRALLLRAVEIAAAATPGRVLVVLGAQGLRLRQLLRRHRADVNIVYNGRWAEGMAGSFRTGIGALPTRTRAALFMAVDQPSLTPASIDRLVRAWAAHPGRAAAASYGGHVGVPAILPRRALRRLRDASGDIGARALLRGGEVDVTRIEMPEASFDLDTVEDLARLR